MLELHHWGYDFSCDKPIDAILATFNAAGPWEWELRNSDLYGDYLNCRPKVHAQVRVYEYSQMRSASDGRREGFSAWLESDAGDMATQAEIDHVFRRLLQGIDSRNLTKT
jgi:hypothetical protein